MLFIGLIVIHVWVASRATVKNRSVNCPNEFWATMAVTCIRPRLYPGLKYGSVVYEQQEYGRCARTCASPVPGEL